MKIIWIKNILRCAAKIPQNKIVYIGQKKWKYLHCWTNEKEN